MMTIKKPYFAHSSECASKSVIASRRPQRRVVEKKQRFARDAQTASPPMSQQPPRLSLFVILRVWWSVKKRLNFGKMKLFT